MLSAAGILSDGYKAAIEQATHRQSIRRAVGPVGVVQLHCQLLDTRMITHLD